LVRVTRVLLLSEAARQVTPDTDLRGIVDGVHASLRDRAFAVAHEEVKDPPDVERAVRAHVPDVVFNLCETLGGGSESELVVPRILEDLRVAFTGNDSSCLRRCMRKLDTSELLRLAAVTVPATFAVETDRDCEALPPWVYPVIVKPDCEDGSLGIDADSVAGDAEAVRRVVERLRARGLRSIAQQYVEGREIAIALLGAPLSPLSPGEVLFDEGAFAGRARILTYASKWDEGTVDYRATRSVGAELGSAELACVTETAIRPAAAVEKRDYGRVDMRVDPIGRAFVIDVNPNCDLSDDGGFMRAARRSGLTRDDVVDTLVRSALARRS
jgi:D-alanine-D-alanine ligase